MRRGNSFHLTLDKLGLKQLPLEQLEGLHLSLLDLRSNNLSTKIWCRGGVEHGFLAAFDNVLAEFVLPQSSPLP